jgi:hypothetical protein
MTDLASFNAAKQQFEQNPYDVAAFVRYFGHSLVHQGASSGNLLQMVQVLIRSDHAQPLFRQLALGQIDISYSNGVFYVGRMLLLSTEQKHRISAALHHLSILLQQPAPVLFVCALPSAMHPPYTISLAPGCGLITLAETEAEPAVLMHELAHLMWCCGHYFLDEGLAWYIESHYAGTAIEKPVQSEWSFARALLIKDIEQLHQLPESAVTELRWLGLQLIDTVVKKSGISALIDFFRQYSNLTAQMSAQQAIEQHFSIVLSDLEPYSHLLENQALAQQLSQQVNQAYFSGKLNLLPALITQMESLVLDPEQKAALIRGYFAMCFYLQKEDTHRLKLLELLQLKAQPESAEDYVFAMMHCSLQIRQVRSYLELQELASQIEHLFQQGLTTFPDHAELHLMRGKSLAETPLQHGGNPTLARQHFRRATDDPVWGPWIRELTQSYLEHSI